ncbi:MAG: DUF3333 domain-containing protein, partial [Rhodospirillaceae bacterium]|nr:DUF3333 domain-containing protein [Rhodospirillaceae bacterium]
MSDRPPVATPAQPVGKRPNLSPAWIRRRYAAERRFKLYGQLAVMAAIAMLAVLLVSICSRGYSAFAQTEITLDVFIDPAVVAPAGATDNDTLLAADYQGLIKDTLKEMFPAVTSRGDRRNLYGMISNAAGNEIRQAVLANPALIGTTQRFTVAADDNVDMLHKGFIDRALPESERVVSDGEILWYDQLVAEGRLGLGLNTTFLSTGDSREPEQAGVFGALMGTVFTMLVTIALALPLGVMSAIYLEEFAPKNRATELIEVNINNLAAVPSIVFGLLGLAVLLGV